MHTNVASSLDASLQVEAADQLERLLSSELFASSERASRFLRYVVERTLAGKAGEIKELVIAVELYGRTGSYDPRSDSTVRVEASRLRGKLQRYYEAQGSEDPIRITIPKGAYVPQFERVARRIEATDDARQASEPHPGAIIESGARRGTRPTPRISVLLLLAIVAMASASRPWPDRAGERLANVSRGHASARDVRADALAAWQEGNELLRQDPHTGSSGRGMPRTLERAIERYEVAVATSPTFAAGWASLAEAYEYASAFVGRNAAADAQRAEASARRAVALDPDLPAGHATLALVLFYLRWDFAGAEVEYRRAIELDPRAAWAIVEYADLLRETNRLERAAVEIRRARALQPVLPVLAIKQAEILLAQGLPDEAIATAGAALDLRDDSQKAHLVLGMAREARGDHEQALTHYRRALDLHARDRHTLPALGYLLGRMGRIDEARDVLRRLEDLNDRVRICAYQIAIVHVGLGEDEQALDWLERAFARRQMHVPFMVVEPRFKSLQAKPRFQAMVRRLGLESLK